MGIPNTASASFTAQAEPDSLDFDIVSGAMNGTGVMSGCACTPASSGVNLGVAVALGSVQVAGTTVAVTAGTVTPGAANATNPRFDLVAVDSSGTKSIVAGTAAANPVFPAPGTKAVLASVYIPATATSITTANIVDKRQLMMADAVATSASLRTIGTGSQQAAAGNHNHAGTYASTAHASTHATAGSDPLAVDIAPTDIHPIRTVSTDGTGFCRRVAQAAATIPVSEMATENELTDWVEAIGWRPTRMVRSYWNSIQVPDVALWGPDCQFVIWPGTSTTPEKAGAPFVSTGTISHPTPTTAHGFHIAMATAASTNATASLASTDVRWAVGDVVNPWNGLFSITRACFPDASYANSGASTGSRIFLGFTDQSAATMLGSDTPTGHRFGFQFCNVNAGKVQTTFQLNRRDGSAESLTNTTIGITQNKWYDFVLHIQPNYSSFTSMYAQIRDAALGTVLYDSGPVTTNGPGATTFMRHMFGIQTINAVARNIKMRRMVVETPVD